VGKSVSTSDKFSFNDSFSCQLRKIKVPMASLDEGTDTKRVEEDRSIAIEAAVVSHSCWWCAALPSVSSCDRVRWRSQVRTMKTRKAMNHQALVAEVIAQLHFFRPNPKVCAAVLCAVLCCAVLCCAVLCCAVLCCAVRCVCIHV
jgi:cullin 1